MNQNTQNETCYAEIDLGYFKQGENMRQSVFRTRNVLDACKDNEQLLYNAYLHLKKIIDILEIHRDKMGSCTIDANSNHIGISGPFEIIEELINKGLADSSYNFYDNKNDNDGTFIYNSEDDDCA